jgi:hypothetical protein
MLLPSVVIDIDDLFFRQIYCWVWCKRGAIQGQKLGIHPVLTNQTLVYSGKIIGYCIQLVFALAKFQPGNRLQMNFIRAIREA